MATLDKNSKLSFQSSRSQCPTWSLVPVRAVSRSLPSAIVAAPNGSAASESFAAPPASDTFGADLAREMIELRGYAIWLCRSGDLADDLIQDTLLKAWLARDRFQAGTNLKAWCTTILRNVFLSYRRRSWRWQPLSDEVSEELASECADTGDALDLLALRNAIALLPRDQREALIVISVGGLSYIEAAVILACAVGTVKSRVSRARLHLAVLMADNKAGFSSDSTLSASGALDDLMEQVAHIKSRVSCSESACQSQAKFAVHSESA